MRNHTPKHGEAGHRCSAECVHRDPTINSDEGLRAYSRDLDKFKVKSLESLVTRRQFIKKTAQLGGAAVLGSSLLSLAACSPGQEESGNASADSDLEKPNLRIGFIPITCATPIIMAEPMNFYENNGLNVTVEKYGGWADIRDAFIAGEIDAAHLLSPMPIALSLGLGHQEIPTRLPAIENINGQAITLSHKHQGVTGPQDFKGMTLAVPFEFSMHNFLLRHYLADGGVDPDMEVAIEVVRPPDMVASLAAGNIDGYLAPDPFNQRGVHEGVGFLFKMSNEIWNNHPCCAFAASQNFIDENPRTYNALLTSIAEATEFSSDSANRERISEIIAPTQYLNQPPEVIKEVLTGHYQDGLGNEVRNEGRIDFDGFPYQSFGAWITTQMIRWGYISENDAANIDVKQVAEEVFLAEDFRNVQQRLGNEVPSENYKIEEILGVEFDANHPERWMEKNIRS
jgi:nitrate/nitrite transport system substrate-binding protein